MISIIVGTNRQNSKSLKIAQIYQSKLNAQQQSNQIIELSQLPTDFVFSALYQNNGKSADFNVFREKIDQSSAYIFVIPEYNGSYSGVLKAFLDGLSYPSSLANKKVALVGLSSGMQGGGLALSHFADIMSYLGAETLALRVKMPFIEKNLKENQLSNQVYEQLVDEQIQKLLENLKLVEMQLYTK